MEMLPHNLEHLDEVVIPEYRPDEPPPKPLGDLPPWRTTVPVLLILLVVLVALGFLAELAHRGLPR